LIELGSERVHQLYDQREAEFTEPVMRQIEKIVMLQTSIRFGRIICSRWII